MSKINVYDAAVLQEIHAQNTGRRYAFAVQLEHPDLAAPLRYVVSRQPFTVLGNVHTPFRFRFVKPAQEEVGFTPARLQLDALANSAEVSAAIQTLGGDVAFTLYLVDLEGDGTPIDSWQNLTLSRVRGTNVFLECDLAIAERFDVEPFPGLIVTPSSHPGAFGVGENA